VTLCGRKASELEGVRRKRRKKEWWRCGAAATKTLLLPPSSRASRPHIHPLRSVKRSASRQGNVFEKEEEEEKGDTGEMGNCFL